MNPDRVYRAAENEKNDREEFMPTLLSCWAARSIWLSPFDCAQGRHGLVGLGPDPSWSLPWARRRFEGSRSSAHEISHGAF